MLMRHFQTGSVLIWAWAALPAFAASAVPGGQKGGMVGHMGATVGQNGGTDTGGIPPAGGQATCVQTVAAVCGI